MKESKAMARKEVDFMKRNAAPASMIKHEQAELKAMKSGGAVRGYGAARKRSGPVKGA